MNTLNETGTRWIPDSATGTIGAMDKTDIANGTNGTAAKVAALLKRERDDWFGFCDAVYATPITTQYLTVPRNDEDYWMQTTNEYFNYLKLPRQKAKAFLEGWLRKIRQAKSAGGVNGMNWQESLSRREDVLANLLHFKNFYTNCGVEMYLQMALNAFIEVPNEELST